MLEILTLLIGIAGIVGWSVLRPAFLRLWYRLRDRTIGPAVKHGGIAAVNRAALESLPPANATEMPLRLEPLASSTVQTGSAAPGPGWTPEEFIAELGAGLHAIVGDGGVGKSHAMAAITRLLAGRTDKLVLNLPVDMLAAIDDIETSFLKAIEAELFALLKEKGDIVFIVDAINQLAPDKKNDAVIKLRHLTTKYPAATVLFSCRRSGFPHQLEVITRRFALRPPTREDAERFIGQRVAAAGMDMPAEIPDHVWALCNTPLLLTMLAAILTSGSKAALPHTLTELYNTFLNDLYDREEEQFSFTLLRRHREALLSYMAFEKGNAGTQFSLHEVEAMVDTFLRAQNLPTMSGAETFMREVPGHPPFEVAGSTRSSKFYSYFHHSILEYYCANWIHQSVPDADKLDLVLKLATEPSEKFWPSIVFYSGFLKPADALIDALARQAETHSASVQEQRLFRLAAMCAAQSVIADPQTIDRLVIAILVAFKFGTVSFNQELVETLRLVGAEKRSAGFPARITDDIEYWIDKYARVRVFPGTSEESIGNISAMLEASDPNAVCDALVQLTAHPERATCTDKVLGLIDSPYAMVREQALSALGHMPGADINIGRPLCGVLFDQKRSAHEKALAMLSCGRLGLKDTFGFLERYLRDPANPFRENASWAIFGLVSAHPDDLRMRQRAQAAYADTLSGPGSRYCIANTLYCLSSLHMEQLTDTVFAFHDRQTDPHILEDSYIALGKIGADSHWPVFVAGFTHGDPLVRYAALTGCRIFLERHPDHATALLDAARPLVADPSRAVSTKAAAITSPG